MIFEWMKKAGAAKSIVFVACLTAYLIAAFVWTTVPVPDYSPSTQVLLVALLSTFFNFFVVFYHYTRPAHPKFLMLPRRRLSLVLHLIGGSVELVAAIAAYATGSHVLGLIAALAALLLHTPTAIYQTPIVFGSKAVMTPSYIFVTALHAYCAFHLLQSPSSTYWLMNTYLALNTYVWCRVFFVALRHLGLFRDSLYTAAITLAPFVTYPAIMGPIGPLLHIGFVLLFTVLARWLFRPSSEQYRNLAREYGRATVIDPGAKSLWMSKRLYAAGVADPTRVDPCEETYVRKIFDQLDTDHDGVLSGEEIKSILADWDMPIDSVQAFLRQYCDNGRIDFNTCYKKLWRIESIQDRLTQPLQPGKKYSEREQADFVFDQVDIDRSGYLEAFEIRMLLIEWGLPEKEVTGYVRLFDINHDNRFSRDEFYQHFRAIWRHCFHQIQTGQTTM
ncbi:MAG: hypothetical protein FJ145_22055 [Deltaproteobacteria bacterium]|nr:hypothetical protein [Deltaproteobacteria bacterium]